VERRGRGGGEAGERLWRGGGEGGRGVGEAGERRGKGGGEAGERRDAWRNALIANVIREMTSRELGLRCVTKQSLGLAEAFSSLLVVILSLYQDWPKRRRLDDWR
jgi:hypothetical protein